MPGTPAREKPKQARSYTELTWSEMEFNCAVYADVMKVKRKSRYSLPKLPEGMTWDKMFAANPKKTYRALKGAMKRQALVTRFPKVAEWNNCHSEEESPFRLDISGSLREKLLTIGPFNSSGYKYTPLEQLRAEADAEFKRVKKAGNILLNFMLKSAKPGTPIINITNKVYALLNKQVNNSPLLRHSSSTSGS